jgi:hypothetical protein
MALNGVSLDAQFPGPGAGGITVSIQRLGLPSPTPVLAANCLSYVAICSGWAHQCPHQESSLGCRGHNATS